jgi:integrase
LLGEIRWRIKDGKFKFIDYFPDSPKAVKFGHVAAKKNKLGNLLRDHLKGYKRAVKNGQMSPSTLEGYRKLIDGQLIPKFEDVYLEDVTPAMLRKWISELGVTGKTVRNKLTPLRSIFDDALNDELIPYNPLDKIALKKLISRTATKSEYEVDPFDADEKTVILTAATGQVKNLFQFALWSGLRTSELIALEWGDIDWVHGTVRVQRAVVAKTEKGTKTDAGTRDVLLLPLAKAALLAQKEFTFLEGKRVFHNPKTCKPWETDGQIRKSGWIPLLKRAGVRYRNPYQTRHTYASTLLSANENPWWVAEQMGHVDVEMIFKHYGKWIPNMKKGQHQTVNDWSQVHDSFVRQASASAA